MDARPGADMTGTSSSGNLDDMLIVISVAGIVLGLIFLSISLASRGDYYIAEVISYDLIKGDLEFIFHRLTYTPESEATINYHGGYLYHLLLWYWGALGHSEIILRSFSLLTGLASLVLLWFATRRLGKTVAWSLVSLCATSPILIDLFTSARSYSLFFFLSIASSASFLAMLRRRKYALLYTISTIALLYTHHFSIYLVAVHLLFFAGIGPRRFKRSLSVVPCIASLSAIVAAALPMRTMVYRHLQSRELGFPETFEMFRIKAWPNEWWFLLKRISQQNDYFNLVGADILETTYMIVMVLLTILGFTAMLRRSRAIFTMMVCMVLLPSTLHTLVVALSSNDVVGLRYFIYFVPVIHLAWVMLIDRSRQTCTVSYRRYLPVALLSLMLAMNLSAGAYSFKTLTWANLMEIDESEQLPDSQPWRMCTDWRGLATRIHRSPPGSRVVFIPHIKDALYAEYYLPEEHVVSIPSDKLDDRRYIRHIYETLGWKYELIWVVSMQSSEEGVLNYFPPATEIFHGKFGALDAFLLKPQDTSHSDRHIAFEDFFAAFPGLRYFHELIIEAPDLYSIDILARAMDNPPFTCMMILEVDGMEVDRRLAGSTVGMLNRFLVHFQPGRHLVGVTFSTP